MKFAVAALVLVVVLQVQCLGMFEGMAMLKKMTAYLSGQKKNARSALKNTDGMTNRELFSKFEAGESLIWLLDEFKNLNEIQKEIVDETQAWLNSPQDGVSSDTYMLTKVATKAKKLQDLMEKKEQFDKEYNTLMEHIEVTSDETYQMVSNIMKSFAKDEL